MASRASIYWSTTILDKVVSLRKVGKFYNVYSDDAYVLHYIMGYTISNGRVGFPINALGKVQNQLEAYRVSYRIIEKDDIKEQKKFRKDNRYDKCYQEGLKSFHRTRNEEILKEKIKMLPKDKVEEMLKYIEKMLDAVE